MRQFLSHTPTYVWAILAFLIYRGVVALRERELRLPALFILPAVMLLLSLHDIGAKFGGAFALAIWALGALAAGLIAWTRDSPRLAPGAAPGRVRIPGSRAPLAMMMAIFVTKYAACAALVMQPRLGRDALFVMAVCLAYGAFNGCFLGRLAGDLKAWRALQAQARTQAGAAV